MVLPFGTSTLAFCVFSTGTTLSVRYTALAPLAFFALVVSLPIVVKRSMREAHQRSDQLRTVPAYRFFGSWTAVIVLRCLLVGAGAVLCAYLWLQLLGENIDGDLARIDATVIRISTGSAKGGCAWRATFEFEGGSDEICVSRVGHRPLMSENVAEGQKVALTIKKNLLSTSVASIELLH